MQRLVSSARQRELRAAEDHPFDEKGKGTKVAAKSGGLVL